MASLFSLFTLFLFSASLFVSTSEACSCEALRLRETFCRSKYSALVLVNGRGSSDVISDSYSVKVKNVINARDEGRSALGDNLIWTKRRKSTCNLILREKELHLIFGDPS